MADFDLVIRGGTVATAADTTNCDVGIKDGAVAALGRQLGAGLREIDARGKLVLPGGIDSHCHIEQRSSAGVICADDFYSGTVAAAFGGTTTVIPFAAQHRGQSLRQVVEDYHAAAQPKAVIDYAFHLIISDPTEQVLGQELPALIRDGYTSFKVYMTYDLLQLDDHQLLDILALARREGALVMVHAENYDMIRWLTARLLESGRTARVTMRSATPGWLKARRPTGRSVLPNCWTCRSCWSTSRRPKRSRRSAAPRPRGSRSMARLARNTCF